MREKDQADFDIERMFAYLDEALTSKDERVQSALRGLLTIIELTRTQDDGKNLVETSHGPLRQMQEDVKHMNRRLNNLAEEMRQMKQPPYAPPANPYMPGPYNPGYPNTGTPSMPNPPGLWWGADPNLPYTTSKSSSSYIPPGPFTLTDNEKDSTINIKLTK